jgi:hypothetical protein
MEKNYSVLELSNIFKKIESIKCIRCCDGIKDQLITDDRVYMCLVRSFFNGANLDYIEKLNDHKGCLNVHLKWGKITDPIELSNTINALCDSWSYYGEHRNHVYFSNINLQCTYIY